MFKALLTTLTVALATSLFAGNPSDWYTPENYHAPSGYEATAAVVDARGTTHEVSFTVSLDEDGNVTDSSLQNALGDIKLSIQSAVSLIDETIKGVAQNAADIHYLRAMIETLGENLTRVFQVDGWDVNIGGKVYTLKIDKGKLESAIKDGTTINYEDKNGLFSIPDGKSIQSFVGDNGANLLCIKGWNEDSSTRITIADILAHKAANGEENNRIVAKAPNGQLVYIPVGKMDSGSFDIPPDLWALDKHIENSKTNLTISGWYDQEAFDMTLADYMTLNPEKVAQSKIMFGVLARAKSGERKPLMVYFEPGNLYGVTWATNWTEAVKHITTEETIKIVNWTTNWVNHTHFVTNYEDIVRVTTNLVYHENFVTNIFNHENFVTNLFVHENFVTNVFNHENFVTNAITQLKTIVNWQVVTNYIVRYMGGGTSGGDNFTPQPIDPRNDPYHEEYEEQKGDENILPLRNARHIVAMSNEFFKAVSTMDALDGASIWTNDAARAEIAGFWQAKTNQTPVKVLVEGVEGANGEPVYAIDWADYPSELVAMTAGDINEIYEWWTKHSSVTNFLANIITNTEALAELKTNTFEIIDADRMLDGESVWTNGAAAVEIKGFANAVENTSPVVGFDLETQKKVLEWRPIARPDNAVLFSQDSETPVINRSLEVINDYGMDSATNVWSIYGFDTAPENTAPHVKVDEYGGRLLEWRATSGTIRVIGTDETEAVIGGETAHTNTLTFASAADSNVKVTVVGDDAGNVTVTFGVYYLQESNLNGSSGGGSGL